MLILYGLLLQLWAAWHLSKVGAHDIKITHELRDQNPAPLPLQVKPTESTDLTAPNSPKKSCLPRIGVGAYEFLVCARKAVGSIKKITHFIIVRSRAE